MENKVSSRKLSCDYMKGILSIIMITSHIKGLILGFDAFDHYAGLTSFSGFLFCFGYSTSMTYLEKEKAPVMKLLKGALKTFIAYYISALAYIIICGKNFSIDYILQILLQKNLAGYSEFLIAWSYLYILIILLFIPLKKLLNTPLALLVVACVSVLLTFIPYEMLNIPWLGSLIGYGNNFCFPILQYSSYYLAGAYFGKTKKVFHPVVFVIALLGTTIYEVAYRGFGVYPQRWAPSFIFVVGGYLFVYMYYILCEGLEKRNINLPLLQFIGRNSLTFLIVSNIFTFLCFLMDLNSIPLNVYVFFLVYFVIVFVVCGLVAYLFELRKKRLR